MLAADCLVESKGWYWAANAPVALLAGGMVAMVFAAILPKSKVKKGATPPPPPPLPPGVPKQGEEEKIDKDIPWHIVLGASALTVYFTLFMDCASTMMLVPLMPYLCRSLGASVPQIGFAIAASQLTQVPGSMLLGFLGDKYGAKATLVPSVVLYGITYLHCGLATEYWQLLLARLFTGVFSATFVLCLMQLAQTTPKEHRAQVIGLGSFSSGAGHLIGPAMSGILSAYSYSAPLFVSAGLCWFNALCVQVFLPSSGVQEEEPDEAPPPVTLTDALRLLITTPVLLLVYVAAFLDQACFIGVVQMATLFFQDVFGMPSTTTGFVLAFGVVEMLLGGLLTGFLTRRLGSGATIALASGLRALASFGLVGIRSEEMAWVLFMVCFGVEPWLMGSIFAMVDELVPPQIRGSAFGYIGAFRGCGFMLGLMGSSFLYAVDINLPFIACGVGQAVLIPALVACLGLHAALFSRVPHAQGLLVKGQEKK